MVSIRHQRFVIQKNKDREVAKKDSVPTNNNFTLITITPGLRFQSLTKSWSSETAPKVTTSTRFMLQGHIEETLACLTSFTY